MAMIWLRTVAACAAWVTMTGCAGAAPTAAALPADQIVFMVRSWGGMVPPVAYAMQSPALVIYGDGRVLTAVEPAVPRLVPMRYELARVDPGAVQRFVTSALSGGLLGGRMDFGSPKVTDLDTTTVIADDGSGPAEAAVYALSESVDTGLSPAQQDARSRLRVLIEQAGDLAAGAAGTPYVPDRVVVYEPMSSGTGDPAVVPWPGPAPSGFLVPTSAGRSVACGEVGGADAGTLYRAALDNPGARWLVDGTTRVLAVNPVPLRSACP